MKHQSQRTTDSLPKTFSAQATSRPINLPCLTGPSRELDCIITLYLFPAETISGNNIRAKTVIKIFFIPYNFIFWVTKVAKKAMASKFYEYI